MATLNRCGACNAPLGLLPGRHNCQADPDLVARRLVMHRSLWDRCVAEAARRNADGWSLTDHVLPADVAVEALERGATWPTHHADPLSRPCPTCPAKVGEKCRTPSGLDSLNGPHARRRHPRRSGGV